MDYVEEQQNIVGNKGIMGNYASFVEMDKEAYVVLPVTADFSDVKSTLESEDMPGNVIGRLNYTYGNHLVGTVDIIPSGVVIEDNFFAEKNNQTDVNVVEIKSKTIVWIVILLILLIVAIFFGKKFYDNYYVILHDLEVRKQRRSRFRPINKKKKRWRRRDRMFK